jgi:hypothetical protein
MTGLDLRALMPAMEDMLLLDTIRVTEPSSGGRVLDTSTGELGDAEPAVLYQDAGAIYPSGVQPPISAPYALQAWRDNPRSVYRMLTPVSAPLVPRDAVVEVVVSARDDALVGRTWRALDESLASSQIVLRVTWIQAVKPKAADPDA